MDNTTLLRARDITIGTAGIAVEEAGTRWQVEVPRCPHSLAEIDPRHRRIAQALAGEPLYAVERIPVEDAREEADNARTELAGLEAMGLHGYAATAAHKKPEDVTPEDEERARDLYEDRLEELHRVIDEAPAGNATRPVEVSKSAEQITAEIMASCCGEVYTLDNGKSLKVPKNMSDPDGEMLTLETPPEMVAWILRGRGEYIRGQRGVDAPTLFAYMRQEARRFRAVATAPHWPMIADVHYRIPAYGERAYAPGEAFMHALGLHCVAEGAGNAITCVAAFLSPGCGTPGYRPITVFTSNGEGSGKTSTAESVARMWGGLDARILAAMPTDKYRLAETMQETFFRMAGALDDGIDVRAVLLDNIRGDLNLTELCAATSDPVVSQRVKGKKGGTRAPNVFAWMGTTNNMDPTGEMARRLFTCALAKPPAPKDGERSWADRATEFFTEHGWECREDAIEALKKYGDPEAYPVPPVARHTTFVSYEQHLLWPAALVLAHGEVGVASKLFREGVADIVARITAMDSDAGAALEAELAVSQAMADFDTETSVTYLSSSGRHGHVIDAELVPLDSMPSYLRKTDLEHICRRENIDADQVIEAATAGKCDCLFFAEAIRQFPKKDRMGTKPAPQGLTPFKGGRLEKQRSLLVKRATGFLYVPDGWDGKTTDVQILQNFRDANGRNKLMVQALLPADKDIQGVLLKVKADRDSKAEAARDKEEVA